MSRIKLFSFSGRKVSKQKRRKRRRRRLRVAEDERIRHFQNLHAPPKLVRGKQKKRTKLVWTELESRQTPKVLTNQFLETVNTHTHIYISTDDIVDRPHVVKLVLPFCFPPPPPHPPLPSFPHPLLIATTRGIIHSN